MVSKRILIVSAGFYPHNSPRSFRTTELAKEFARQGHSVKVLIPDVSDIHHEFEKKHSLIIDSLGKRKWRRISLKGKGIEILVRRFILRFSKLLFEYPDIELSWMVKKKLKDESGFDLLVSVAVPYPIHWGVAASYTKNHRVADIWVADCGDPYIKRENDTFNVPFYFGFVEKWFMRKADFISVPTKGAIAAYYPEFHPKIRIIPQGFRFEDYQFNNNKSRNFKPTFAYAGGFIPGRRDPTEFINYLKQQDFDFEFHIYTYTPKIVSGIIGDLKDKIIVHDPIERQELLGKLSSMDFMINFENAGGYQTPSKLIDYLILRKPILSIKTGSLDVKVVKEFLSGNYQRQFVVEDPDQYRIENITRKFLKLI